MTKAAVVNMVSWLSQELMQDDIRVNAVGPAFVQTEMTKPMYEKTKDPSFGYPHEIAAIAALICSDDGSFINGETYYAKGMLKL